MVLRKVNQGMTVLGLRAFCVCRFWGFGIFFFFFPFHGLEQRWTKYFISKMLTQLVLRREVGRHVFLSCLYVCKMFFLSEVGSCWGRYQVRGAAAQLVSASKRWPSDTKLWSRVRTWGIEGLEKVRVDLICIFIYIIIFFVYFIVCFKSPFIWSPGTDGSGL